MNNDGDLIFIAVWQQMIGFSNMAYLFDLDGGPYSYLDFKKWSLSNFSSIHVLQTQAFLSKQDVHSRWKSQWLQKVFRHLKKNA